MKRINWFQVAVYQVKAWLNSVFRLNLDKTYMQEYNAKVIEAILESHFHKTNKGFISLDDIENEVRYTRIKNFYGVPKFIVDRKITESIIKSFLDNNILSYKENEGVTEYGLSGFLLSN